MPTTLSSRFALTTALVLAVCGPAFAQTVPPSAETGRVQEQIKEKQLPVLQKTDIENRANPIIEAPAGAEKITLTLADIQFEGVTVYSSRQLAKFYADMVGQKITLADIYGLAAHLTATYRNDGYILTQVVVPPQTIDKGHVRLQVIEGYIDGVTVEGELTPAERKTVEAYANRVKNSHPLRMRDLERALLSINDLPGISARGVLSPSPTKQGAADLTVLISGRDKFEGRFGLDNFGSRYLGQYEVTTGLYANSLLGIGDRFGIQAVYAPGAELDKELAYGELSYTQPIGTYGTQLEVHGSYSSTEPGYTLEEFNVDGKSLFWSAQVNQPVIRTRNLNWSFSGGFDWRNTQTVSDIDTPRHDDIRAVRLGTSFDAVDTFLGAGFNSVNLELSHGLNVMGASNAGDDDLSRSMGDPEFTKIAGEYQRLQRVVNDVNILFAAKGQLASDALLSSEEFGVGGAAYGRGYDASEIVGEHGVAGKLELQWSNPVTISSAILDSYQLYSFADAGRVWNTDATTNADKRNTLSSAGVGARVTFAGDTQGGLFMALPLSRDVEAEGDRGARVFVNQSHAF